MIHTNKTGATSLAYMKGEMELDLHKPRFYRKKLIDKPAKKTDPLKGLHKCKICTGYIFKKQKICFGCSYTLTHKRKNQLGVF